MGFNSALKGLIQSVIYFDSNFKAGFVALNAEVYSHFFHRSLCSPTTLKVKEEDTASQSATFAGN